MRSDRTCAALPPRRSAQADPPACAAHPPSAATHSSGLFLQRPNAHAHLVDRDDLAVGLLHTAQAAHEVPEAGASADQVLGKELHAVDLAHGCGLAVLGVGHEAPDHHVLLLARGQRLKGRLAHGWPAPQRTMPRSPSQNRKTKLVLSRRHIWHMVTHPPRERVRP